MKTLADLNQISETIYASRNLLKKIAHLKALPADVEITIKNAMLDCSVPVFTVPCAVAQNLLIPMLEKQLAANIAFLKREGYSHKEAEDIEPDDLFNDGDQPPARKRSRLTSKSLR
jgi:hypothetical protein